MIRINLLASGKTSSTAPGPNIVELVIFVMLLLAGLGGVAFWWYSYEERISFAKHRLKQEQQEVARLQVAIRMVKKYKATKALLKKQLDVIEKLKRAKTGPVRVLDEISIRIPKQIWISSIIQRRGRLVIEGDAESNEWVALFNKTLENSPYFKSVELKFTFRTSGTVFGGTQSLDRIKFRFECRVTFAA